MAETTCWNCGAEIESGEEPVLVYVAYLGEYRAMHDYCADKDEPAPLYDTWAEYYGEC